jgi:hypothetical protein
MNLKYELQRIISGVGKNPEGNIIKSATHFLRKSKEASGDAQANEFTKSQETARLISWVEDSKLWFHDIDEKRFIAQGAEQKVYLDEDAKHVIKLNDTIFYAYWEDYLHNLLIHNFLFPETAYSLIGFHLEDSHLKAVVRQPFIEITEPTDPGIVKEFLFANGFKLKKNNDYFHPDIGIILEDLHDENVLTNKGTLFFIDTIFYLTSSFYSDPN